MNSIVPRLTVVRWALSYAMTAYGEPLLYLDSENTEEDPWGGDIGEESPLSSSDPTPLRGIVRESLKRKHCTLLGMDYPSDLVILLAAHEVSTPLQSGGEIVCRGRVYLVESIRQSLAWDTMFLLTILNCGEL